MALVVFVRHVKGDVTHKLWKFDVEHLAGAVDNVVAAISRHDAPENQHVSNVVKRREMCDAVTEVRADGLIDLVRATSPSTMSCCTSFSRSGSGMIDR